MMAEEAKCFLDEFYDQKYFLIIGEEKIPSIHFDNNFEAPYNIKDCWENIDAASHFLDQEFMKWTSEKN